MSAVITLKKTGSWGSGLKFAVGTFAMDSSYPTGGEVIVPLSDLGLNEVYGYNIPPDPANGIDFKYDITNKKIMAYNARGNGLGGGPVPVAFAGIQNAITASGTTYIGPTDNAENAAEDVALVIPAAGTISTLRASLGTANGSAGETAKKIDLTVRKNGEDTTIVTSIAADAVTGSDTTHSVTVAAGDLITIKCVAAGSISGADLNLSLAYTPAASSVQEVAATTNLAAITAQPFIFWGW